MIFWCLSKIFLQYYNCLWCQPQTLAVGPATALIFATARCGTVWKSPARETELCWWKMGRRRGEQTISLWGGVGFKQVHLAKAGGQEKWDKAQVADSGRVGNEQCGTVHYWVYGFTMPACRAQGFSCRSRDQEHSGCNAALTSHDKCQLC